jgi:hypothetical protein
MYHMDRYSAHKQWEILACWIEVLTLQQFPTREALGFLLKMLRLSLSAIREPMQRIRTQQRVDFAVCMTIDDNIP